MSALYYSLTGMLGPLGIAPIKPPAPFDPLSMPGLLAAYESNVGTWADTGKKTAATNGVLCTVWADRSANGNDLIPLVGYPTAVPTFVTAVVNGLPVLRFTSSSVGYKLTAALSTVQTVYLVYRPIVDGSVIFMGLLGDASNYNYAPAQNKARSAMFDISNWSNNVASGKAWLNGTQITPPSSLVWTSGWQVLALRQAGTTYVSQISLDRNIAFRSFYGDFAAIYLGSSTVTDTFNTNMISYLRSKYAF